MIANGKVDDDEIEPLMPEDEAQDVDPIVTEKDPEDKDAAGSPEVAPEDAGSAEEGTSASEPLQTTEEGLLDGIPDGLVFGSREEARKKIGKKALEEDAYLRIDLANSKRPTYVLLASKGTIPTSF